MADPTTEIAKEFLEFNNYLVKVEGKFFKNKELKGTAGDIDIIAVRPFNLKFKEFELNKEVVAEVKNWQVSDINSFDDIYDDKFKYINDFDISWKQLRKYISSKKFERILFCFATTDEVYKYAYDKYGVRIITTGFIIKNFCEFIKKAGARTTYYPEAYHYNLVRIIMRYLYQSFNFKDKLLLEDIVWIDPDEEPRWRNKFNKLNSEFMGEFIYHDDERLIKIMEKNPTWFFNELVKIAINNNKPLIKKMKRTLNKF